MSRELWVRMLVITLVGLVAAVLTNGFGEQAALRLPAETTETISAEPVVVTMETLASAPEEPLDSIPELEGEGQGELEVSVVGAGEQVMVRKVPAGPLGRGIEAAGQRVLEKTIRDLAREAPPEAGAVLDLRIHSIDGQQIHLPTVREDTPTRAATPILYRVEAHEARKVDGEYSSRVFLSAYRKAGDRERSVRVDEPTRLILRDEERRLTPQAVVLPAGRSFVEAEPAELRPGTRYRLRVESPSGALSEPEPVDWETHGPDLELRLVYQSEAYATSGTPAFLRAYLTEDGRQSPGTAAEELSVSSSDGLTLEPLKLDEQGTWSTAAYAGGGRDGATVDFTHIDWDLASTATLDFHYPWWRLILAVAMGLVGVLLARQRALFDQSKAAIAIEVLISLAAAGTLYAVLVAGWIPSSLKLPFLVDWVPAAVIGLIGGYAGETVFQVLVKRLLPGVPPADTPPENPPSSPAAPTAAGPGG